MAAHSRPAALVHQPSRPSRVEGGGRPAASIRSHSRYRSPLGCAPCAVQLYAGKEASLQARDCWHPAPRACSNTRSTVSPVSPPHPAALSGALALCRRSRHAGEGAGGRPSAPVCRADPRSTDLLPRPVRGVRPGPPPRIVVWLARHGSDLSPGTWARRLWKAPESRSERAPEPPLVQTHLLRPKSNADLCPSPGCLAVRNRVWGAIHTNTRPALAIEGRRGRWMDSLHRHRQAAAPGSSR